MSPFEVLRLVVSNLEQLNIPYMVGGSFASSAHGFPRSTLDADLILDLRHESVLAFLEVFRRGDFYVDAGQVPQAVKAKRSFKVIHLKTFFKADLFVLRESTFARKEFSRRSLHLLEDPPESPMYVATAEDAILSKLDWYRPGGEASENQWRDVMGILKTQAGRLDLAYLRRWATELKVADLLQRVCGEVGTGVEKIGS